MICLVNVTNKRIYFQKLLKRQKRYETNLKNMSDNFRLLQKAFFDYDCQAHQELSDIEAEFLSYLPIDEVGEKADFIFEDKTFAKTITKAVMSKIQFDGKSTGNLSNLVNETAKKCFSYDLRAHMHIVKQYSKE